MALAAVPNGKVFVHEPNKPLNFRFIIFLFFNVTGLGSETQMETIGINHRVTNLLIESQASDCRAARKKEKSQYFKDMIIKNCPAYVCHRLFSISKTN